MKIVVVTNHIFFAVCGLRLSRLNNFSHTVSRLDLPTLVQILPSKEFRPRSFPYMN